jgi:hypothetical protein
MMAPPRRVRALNACTRVREWARVRGASSEAEVSPRALRNPLEGVVNPRARRSPLAGGVKHRARRNLLEGAFEWAPVGCGDQRSVGHARVCV